MYVQELTVLPSDASCHGELKLRGLLNHLQDTASLAVSELNGSPMQVLARGYTWVLLCYEVELLRHLPALDELFIVKTYHDMNHGYRTLRVFRVETPEGDILVWAKTSWLLLDLAAGRPVRPSGHLPELLSRDTEPIDPNFRDIPAFHSISGDLCETVYPVRFHDLDANGHVNNAVYFEWIFEATPIDPMVYAPKAISASFRSSARLGDVLAVRVREFQDFSPRRERRTFVYEIVGTDRRDGKPLAMFSCTWEPYRS